MVFLAMMTFGTFLPIDYDRSIAAIGVLVLFLFKPRAADGRADCLDAILLAVLGAITLAGMFISTHPSVAMVRGASWVFIVAIGLMAHTVAKEESGIEKLFASIALGGATAVLYVWIARHFTPTGTPLYMHHRLMGLHLTVTTWTALAWLHIAPHRGSLRKLQWLAAILSCAGLLWSGGRAPLVALGGGVAMLFVVSANPQRRQLAAQFTIIMIAAAALSAANWTNRPELGWWHAFSRSVAAENISELTSTRTDFWKITWNEIKQSPLLGHGPDAYRLIRPRLDGHQPHNWVLQWLLDTGLAGALVFFLLLVRLLWRGLRSIKNDVANRWPQAAAAGLFTCMVGGLLDGYFYHAQPFICAAIFAGICAAVPIVQTARRSTAMAGLVLSRNVMFVPATLVLMVHGYLVFAFSHHVSPPPPRGFTAKLARGFPSWNYGLERWLDEWMKTDRATALEWSDWACQHGSNAGFFYYYSAVHYMQAGQLEIASERVDAGLLAAHHSLTEYFISLREHINTLKASGQPGLSPTPESTTH